MLMTSLLTAPLLAAPADERAAEVAARCGPSIYELEELDFVFVSEADGAVTARRAHRWWPRKGAVEVTADGETITLFDIRQGVPATADDARWAEVAPGEDPAAALRAWAQFTNDSYWLLAPCKVMDPGVRRAAGPGGSLELRFEGVGLTPGDVYRLEVDPESGLVSAWSFVLQSGREGRFTWEDYTQVGPLMLSLRRSAEGTTIRFEDVSAR